VIPIEKIQSFWPLAQGKEASWRDRIYVSWVEFLVKIRADSWVYADINQSFEGIDLSKLPDTNDLSLQKQLRESKKIQKWASVVLIERYQNKNDFSIQHLIKVLIKKKTDSSILKKLDGNDSLLFECLDPHREYLDLVRILIEDKGFVDSIKSGENAETALIKAIVFGKTELVALLIEKRINLDIQDENSKTALMLAIEKGNNQIAKLLINSDDINLNKQDKEGFTALMLAAGYGNQEIAKLLIDKKANLKKQDKDKRTALMLAAGYGNQEIAKLLINELIEKQEITELNKPLDIKDNTLLLWLIKNGEINIAEKLIKIRGIDLDKQDNSHKDTALMYAAYKGYTDIVKLLIENRANLNIQDENGLTALMWAIEKENNEIAKLLINSDNIDLNKQDKNSLTALMWAIEKENNEIAKLLINSDGIDLNKQDKQALTALMWALGKGNNEIAKLLIDSDSIDLDKQDKVGRTVLFYAIYQGNTEIVKLLIKNRANLNIQDENLQTALIIAIAKRDSQIAKLLINSDGIDLNKQDKQALTALMWAAGCGNKEIVQLLIDEKADLKLQDKDKKTALTWAIKNNQNLIAKLLINKLIEKQEVTELNKTQDAAGNTTLLWLIKTGEINMAAELIKIPRIDLDKQDNSHKDTALIYAAYKGYTDIVELLIKNRANLNIQDENGLTALMWAAGCGHIEIAKLLIEKGADLKKQDKDKRTALMLAVGNNRNLIAKLLINKLIEQQEITELNKLLDIKDNTTLLWLIKNGEINIAVKLIKIRGIDLDRQNYDGKTALMLVIEMGNTEIAKLLIDNGANLKKQDKEGKTALRYAITNKNDKIRDQIKVILQSLKDLDFEEIIPLKYSVNREIKPIEVNSKIKQPTGKEKESLYDQIEQLGKIIKEKDPTNEMFRESNEIAYYRRSTKWKHCLENIKIYIDKGEDSLVGNNYADPIAKNKVIAMLCALAKYFIGRNYDNENLININQLESFLLRLIDAFISCQNRISTNVEDAYYEYLQVEISLYLQKPKGKIQLALQKFKTDLLSKVIVEILRDPNRFLNRFLRDQTSTLNYYRRKLNKELGLPESVSAYDKTYERSAIHGLDLEIFDKFWNEYIPEIIIRFISSCIHDPEYHVIKAQEFDIWVDGILKDEINKKGKHSLITEEGKWKLSTIAKVLEHYGFLKKID